MKTGYKLTYKEQEIHKSQKCDYSFQILKLCHSNQLLSRKQILSEYIVNKQTIEVRPYFRDLGLILDMDSLSTSLTTKSLLRKNNVPPDTLTGIRTKSTTIAVGPNIFRLSMTKEKYQSNLKGHYLE